MLWMWEHQLRPCDSLIYISKMFGTPKKKTQDPPLSVGLARNGLGLKRPGFKRAQINIRFKIK